eukprot:21117-Heterococcus_DN1.PRE.2
MHAHHVHLQRASERERKRACCSVNCKDDAKQASAAGQGAAQEQWKKKSKSLELSRRMYANRAFK